MTLLHMTLTQAGVTKKTLTVVRVSAGPTWCLQWVLFEIAWWVFSLILKTYLIFNYVSVFLDWCMHMNRSNQGSWRLWIPHGVGVTGDCKPPNKSAGPEPLQQQCVFSVTDKHYTACSAYVLWLLVWCVCGPSNSGSRGISASFTCSWDPLPPTQFPHPAMIRGFVSSLTVSYTVFRWYLWEVWSFLRGNRRGVDLGERGGERAVEGMEGGEEVKLLSGCIISEKNI